MLINESKQRIPKVEKSEITSLSDFSENKFARDTPTIYYEDEELPLPEVDQVVSISQLSLDWL